MGGREAPLGRLGCHRALPNCIVNQGQAMGVRPAAHLHLDLEAYRNDSFICSGGLARALYDAISLVNTHWCEHSHTEQYFEHVTKEEKKYRQMSQIVTGQLK